MNAHQATGHMRSLLSAQHLLMQALRKAERRDIEAAKKLSGSAFNEMRFVRVALNQVNIAGRLEIGPSLIQLFYDDLERQRIEVVEGEILRQEKANRELLENRAVTKK